jgi:hypothetical protein
MQNERWISRGMQRLALVNFTGKYDASNFDGLIKVGTNGLLPVCPPPFRIYCLIVEVSPLVESVCMESGTIPFAVSNAAGVLLFSLGSFPCPPQANRNAEKHTVRIIVSFFMIVILLHRVSNNQARYKTSNPRPEISPNCGS